MIRRHTASPANGDQPNAAERRLAQAAPVGDLIDLRIGDAAQDDPARGPLWAADRQIRAGLLVELLTRQQTPGGRRPRAVKVRGARITGTVDLEAAELACPLLLVDCHVDEPINLNDATAPAIRLPGSHVPGLTADHLRVTGNLELDHGFTAGGEILLYGARIGGVLSFAGARLANPGGRVLYANSLTVEHSMFCNDGFRAYGEIRLQSAYVGGVLDFDSAQLANPGGKVLYAQRLTIANELFCRNGFTATGEIQLSGARIGGGALFTDCTLSNPDGHALDLEAATATALTLLPRQPPDGLVDLTNAQVGAFCDDQATWPATLRLRGFAYQTLDNDHVGTRARLSWLARDQHGYTPQIYDQLAAAYRRAGREQAARQVAIAHQRRRRGVLNPAGKLANWLLYVTVGYGHRTWLAALWLTGLLALGTGVFDLAHAHHMITTETRGADFNALAYTLDVLVPIADLGQKTAWHPKGAAMYASWGFTAAGWVLFTAVAAGMTGVLKR